MRDREGDIGCGVIVIGVFLVILFLIYRHDQNGSQKYFAKTNYLKDRAVIVQRGGYAERNGKFSNLGKYFLIRRVKDTTEYTELNGANWGDLSNFYGSSLYYSKNVGDTLYFDYINKKRFWKKR